MTELEFVAGVIPPQLVRYWTKGEGAARIRWGEPNDFYRCVRELRSEGVDEKYLKGECNRLHKIALGVYPGQEHSLVAAGSPHTGAMVALMPSDADAQRMAMKGGEAAEELHVTMAYLGDAVNWSTQERLEMAATVARHLEYAATVKAEAFALGYFNPHNTDMDTALVYGIGGGDVDRVHSGIRQAIGGYGLKMPDQHAPFVAHMTAKYTDDLSDHHDLVENLGPMVFDRVRLAFGEDYYDIPLGQVDLEALTAAMGNYSPVTWSGPLAPIGKPTGDRRIFPPETLTYQTFPMPLRFQRKGMPGHEGAVVVGRILAAGEGELDGQPHIMGSGDWFNPEIIPEVTEAMALVEGGVSGPSVDLDTFTAAVTEHDGKQILAVREGRIRGATLVSIPAFADLRLQLQHPLVVDEPVDDSSGVSEDLVTPEADTSDPLGDAMVASVQEFASVNASGWKGAPIAPRDAVFDADDAVSRIEAWAGIGGDSPDQSKMSKMFLWINPDGNALGRDGYKLPWGDIFDDKPHLVYHAIYAAAALLEGGHGGLPNIPDEDKARLRSVISDIYAKLAVEFQDPNIQASWDRAAEKASNAEKASAMDLETFDGKYTEKLHPRDYHGRWADVPGHGPHGELLKKGTGSGDSHGGSGKKTPHGAHPAVESNEGPTDKGWLASARKANHGETALDSAPAKLQRAEHGHSGEYGDESLDAPKGAGSARALAEMEGTEYEHTNTQLRSGKLSESTKERVAEVDKTMAVSKLPKDAVVYRGVKDGQQMFKEDWIAPGLKGMSAEEQDKAYDRYYEGKRPDLTGYQWTQKSYLHTTTDAERLNTYAQKHQGFDLEPVAMTIVLPKGTGAVQMSDQKFEAELMAQRGLKLRVAADHGVDSHGVRHLDIEVVGHEA